MDVINPRLTNLEEENKNLRERVIALARSVMEFYATRNTNHVEM